MRKRILHQKWNNKFYFIHLNSVCVSVDVVCVSSTLCMIGYIAVLDLKKKVKYQKDIEWGKEEDTVSQLGKGIKRCYIKKQKKDNLL